MNVCSIKFLNILNKISILSNYSKLSKYLNTSKNVCNVN